MYGWEFNAIAAAKTLATCERSLRLYHGYFGLSWTFLNCEQLKRMKVLFIFIFYFLPVVHAGVVKIVAGLLLIKRH